MAPSITQVLAAVPGNEANEKPLRWSDVGNYVRDLYIKNEDEKLRREKHAERQRLYQAGGDADMDAMLRKVLKSGENIDRRAEWIEYAKFNNVLRRVVGELATVYSMPARRTVADDAANDRYQEVQRLCRQHEVMQRINRLAILHRAVAVGMRMRLGASGQYEPVIDVVTPASFWAVRHPLDPTQLVGLVFENDFAIAVPGTTQVAKYTFWTWNEEVSLSDDCRVIRNRPHGYSTMPWLLFTIEPPNGALLDCETGDDLVAAQKAVSFLNILHLKEAKSATKQMIIQGDLARAMRGQTQDTEVDFELPSDATAQIHDRSMDLGMFRDSARDVYETAAANYGLSPTLLHGNSVESAEARDLMRVPLRELRLQQQIPFRDFERSFAKLQAEVVGKYRGDLAFSTDGWGIDFSDPQTPLGTRESLDVFEKERALTLTSTEKELRRRNPDLSEEQAREIIIQNVADELFRNLVMRPLQQIAGTPGATTPQVNAADTNLATDAIAPDAASKQGVATPMGRNGTIAQSGTEV